MVGIELLTQKNLKKVYGRQVLIGSVRLPETQHFFVRPEDYCRNDGVEQPIVNFAVVYNK